ncbi:MAG: FAD-binding oxidoreductase [Nitrospina sp.]|jgi:FAD/FMN-containing dehydrogenase|nr:FAD-binding oxidoreductase [Nitrospina sp.]MBT3875859.1 FAD-binding oxidoreductase [Nitrospina sp.]MBT4049306.1 FAD-binding oxidoreductase [Nitrospina sp.]MBT4557274.1 FAD-binding oxidoreductase [Nitrospina sp.]MBT5347546.1 FAD-binding oxidoreductase [Nitrospina sp.]
MIRKIKPEFIAPYLRDASNFSGGNAEEVVIPESSDELADFLKKETRPITIAGAGTGLTASRIPSGGIIVSLERLNKILDKGPGKVEVGPAVSLNELQKFLAPTEWFYPPNPTETWASLGGNLATNASGSRSYKYGVTRNYVDEVELLLVDGRKTSLKRGLRISEPLTFTDGSEINFPDIKYQSPVCKNAAGYFVQPDMDWLDLFIGSDGTLAIFTNIILRLAPRPDDFVSGVLFFKEEHSCWELIPKIKSMVNQNIDPCSLEYFDHNALERLKSKYTNIPDYSRAAMFFEQDVAKKCDYDGVLENWYEFLNAEEIILEDSWFAQGPKDVQMFQNFRHDAPVLINEENSRAGRVKLGTDMAVPDEYFLSMMELYRETLNDNDVDYIIFGHLGDNHLHINLLPEDSQGDKAQNIYDTLVDQILKWGGTVSAEHGVGKLKKDYFAKMVGPNGLKELSKVKRCLDPQNRLGVGNIL